MHAVMWGKMRVIALLACVAAVSAASTDGAPRIIGGSATTINNYPQMTALLYSANILNFVQECGGSILTTRSLLSAAHCFHDAKNDPQRWRFRVGSSFANSGGTTQNVLQIIIHPNYNRPTWDSDIAILHSRSSIFFSNLIQAARIAGTNYVVGDNQVVWAAGWGTSEFSARSEQLRHVQIWTVNQAVCRQRYGSAAITDNMLCAGWLDVGGRDQCSGDSGGPLLHNGVVVGITSWGNECALARYPGVNVRVSRFTTWIQSTAL